MIWNPWKLRRLLADMTADRDLWKVACEQARDDLREVVSKVAIVQSSGSTLIQREHYLRMSRGGES